MFTDLKMVYKLLSIFVIGRFHIFGSFDVMHILGVMKLIEIIKIIEIKTSKTTKEFFFTLDSNCFN